MGNLNSGKPVSLTEVRRQLHALGDAQDAKFLQGFFKTGPGQYGEGDIFLGIRVPATRRLARLAQHLPRNEVRQLLRAKYHEERLLALLILVRQFERGDEPARREIFELYLREHRWVNNWDLVDLSAPNIVGTWLLERPRPMLAEWAASENLWQRRIAVLATAAFIRRGQFADTLALCEQLLADKQDLMHKACGWMLREVGKRDEAVLKGFLKQHAARMPRTMLRYAIERLPEAERARWLAVKKKVDKPLDLALS